MKYLAIRIIEAIAASELLEKDKKIQAIKDIEKMYESDKDYGGVTDTLIMDTLNNGYANQIESHHIWNSSELGWEFWDKMNTIIGKV